MGISLRLLSNQLAGLFAAEFTKRNNKQKEVIDMVEKMSKVGALTVIWALIGGIAIGGLAGMLVGAIVGKKIEDEANTSN